MKPCLLPAILLQGALCPGELALCGAALNFSQLYFADGPERPHLVLQMEQLQRKANTWLAAALPRAGGRSELQHLLPYFGIWIINAAFVVNNLPALSPSNLKHCTLGFEFSTTHLRTDNDHSQLSTDWPPKKNLKVWKR